MVSMKFAPPKEEKPLPENTELTSKMSRNDVARMKNSTASFKYGNCLSFTRALV